MSAIIGFAGSDTFGKWGLLRKVGILLLPGKINDQQHYSYEKRQTDHDEKNQDDFAVAALASQGRLSILWTA